MSSVKNYGLAEMKLVHLIRLQGFCIVPHHIFLSRKSEYVLMDRSPHSGTLASVLVSLTS